jgi:biotin synthase
MTIQASDMANEHPTTTTGKRHDILDIARQQVLEGGMGLTQAQLEEVLRLPDEALPAALELAHHVRLRHCGEDVEVEGIISIKTGGCPED